MQQRKLFTLKHSIAVPAWWWKVIFVLYKYVSICQTSRRQKVIILGNTEIVIIALVESNKSWIVKRIPFYASLSERLKQTVPISKIQYRENVNSEQTTVQHGRSDHGCQFFLLLASIVVDVDLSSLVPHASHDSWDSGTEALNDCGSN